MSEGAAHRVLIERRGRSHRARCVCGWSGHAWNELRPAEADAWHHVFGDASVVDASAIGDPGAADAVAVAPAPVTSFAPAEPERSHSASLDRIISRVRALADGPSPYRGSATTELWRLAGDDRGRLQEALSEIGELLSRHNRRSAGTADSEWLQLLTAKRLLQEALDHEDARSYL